MNLNREQLTRLYLIVSSGLVERERVAHRAYFDPLLDEQDLATLRDAICSNHHVESFAFSWQYSETAHCFMWSSFLYTNWGKFHAERDRYAEAICDVALQYAAEVLNDV